MRRVVVNGRFFAQPRTGVQRYGVETLLALDRLLGRQPQLLADTAWQLALPRDAVDLPLLEHFEIQVLPLLTGHAWEQVSLAAFARGAYLVNANYSGPLLKRRQLITVHDAGVRAHAQTYTRAYRWFNGAMMALLAPRVDTLMTLSRFSAGELHRHFGLRRDDIVIARSGWEHARRDAADDADDAALLQRHGLTPGGYLFAVGSLKANKNFALIPRALQRLGDRLRLPVAVAGGRDARVFRGIETPPRDALRLLGYVSDAELYALYRHAAWFIFPSVYEGFGLPPLEAMANGCPVLAARSASIPEIYGDAVLYFDAHDAASLAACLEAVTAEGDAAQALRRRCVERAAARLALFTWEANAQILLERLVAVGATGLAGARRRSVDDGAAASVVPGLRSSSSSPS
jgi:glycosyltransferase involved in cell wall biosynthesis